MYRIETLRPISVKKLGQLKIVKMYVRVRVANKTFDAVVSYFKHKHKYYIIFERHEDMGIYEILMDRVPNSELILPREIPKVVLNAP